MTNKTLRVKEGKTELTTEHNGKDLTFLYPPYGPGIYNSIKAGILKDGLSLPSMAKTASLLHTAYNSDDKYSKEIKQIMNSIGLWAFDRDLYIPNKGVYMYPEPLDSILPDESELVKRLEANDPSVRFIPFGFKTGEMSSLALSKHPYIIAKAGDEGAEKLAEVAGKFKHDPRLYSYESVNEPLTRVSVLDSGWYPGELRLGVVGYFRGSWGGLALGVKKTGEAGSAEE